MTRLDTALRLLAATCLIVLGLEAAVASGIELVDELHRGGRCCLSDYTTVLTAAIVAAIDIGLGVFVVLRSSAATWIGAGWAAVSAVVCGAALTLPGILLESGAPTLDQRPAAAMPIIASALAYGLAAAILWNLARQQNMPPRLTLRWPLLVGRAVVAGIASLDVYGALWLAEARVGAGDFASLLPGELLTAVTLLANVAGLWLAHRAATNVVARRSLGAMALLAGIVTVGSMLAFAAGLVPSGFYISLPVLTALPLAGLLLAAAKDVDVPSTVAGVNTAGWVLAVPAILAIAAGSTLVLPQPPATEPRSPSAWPGVSD